ncbi:MAG: hypothetical protein JWL63_1774 [Rhodocyclales bacterium]|nr:hypothetical protein [Rhodocyclales bacterium]
MAAEQGKPSEAPLTHGDVPEQDGSEDPGAGLEFTRDATLMPDRNRAQRGDAPPSPSAAEHVNVRGGLHVPQERAPTGKPQTETQTETHTEGIGEGATVSHVGGGNK